MSAETRPEPFRETPVQDGPPPPREPRHYETHAPRLDSREPDSGPMRRGIMAALGFFVAFVMVEAAAIMLALALAVGPGFAGTAFDVALLVAALAFGVALFVSGRLPLASRTAFWATGITCVGFMMTVLIGICGMRIAGTAG